MTRPERPSLEDEVRQKAWVLRQAAACRQTEDAFGYVEPELRQVMVQVADQLEAAIADKKWQTDRAEKTKAGADESSSG